MVSCGDVPSQSINHSCPDISQQQMSESMHYKTNKRRSSAMDDLINKIHTLSTSSPMPEESELEDLVKKCRGHESELLVDGDSCKLLKTFLFHHPNIGKKLFVSWMISGKEEEISRCVDAIYSSILIGNIIAMMPIPLNNNELMNVMKLLRITTFDLSEVVRKETYMFVLSRIIIKVLRTCDMMLSENYLNTTTLTKEQECLVLYKGRIDVVVEEMLLGANSYTYQDFALHGQVIEHILEASKNHNYHYVKMYFDKIFESTQDAQFITNVNYEKEFKVIKCFVMILKNNDIQPLIPCLLKNLDIILKSSNHSTLLALLITTHGPICDELVIALIPQTRYMYNHELSDLLKTVIYQASETETLRARVREWFLEVYGTHKHGFAFARFICLSSKFKSEDDMVIVLDVGHIEMYHCQMMDLLIPIFKTEIGEFFAKIEDITFGQLFDFKPTMGLIQSYFPYFRDQKLIFEWVQNKLHHNMEPLYLTQEGLNLVRTFWRGSLTGKIRKDFVVRMEKSLKDDDLRYDALKQIVGYDLYRSNNRSWVNLYKKIDNKADAVECTNSEDDDLPCSSKKLTKTERTKKGNVPNKPVVVSTFTPTPKRGRGRPRKQPLLFMPQEAAHTTPPSQPSNKLGRKSNEKETKKHIPPNEEEDMDC
uniref:SOSS complex subunit A homolog n=1 Tax=Rhabditophanes sp. KR3021 TaxID=114890 RepID=A0AC35TPD5_9BILA